MEIYDDNYYAVLKIKFKYFSGNIMESWVP